MRFDIGSIEQIDEPDASLGGILSWYSTIHHEPSRISMPLDEFARVLRAGGTLVLGYFDAPSTESFDHAEADFAARLLIEARNEAESVIVATDKSLRRPDFADLARELPAGEPERIASALDALKQSMSGTDRAVIQDLTHALNHATQRLAELVMNRSVREALAGKNVRDR